MRLYSGLVVIGAGQYRANIGRKFHEYVTFFCFGRNCHIRFMIRLSRCLDSAIVVVERACSCSGELWIPTMKTKPFWQKIVLIAVLSLAIGGQIANAADPVQVADAVIDAPTLCCLGFSVPVTGDDDYDASATIEYRRPGGPWSSGLPMLRVRPEYTSQESTPGDYGFPNPRAQFAGSIFNLQPATTYEIRISVTDPDGGDRVQSLDVTTRRVPRSVPDAARTVVVSNTPDLNSAVAAAQPGDVIELQSGNYNGPITIANDGTVNNPIIIRGVSRDTVTIDASGATYGITIWGSHVYVEDITVSGSTWGARAYDTEGVVIRRSRFTGIRRGINAKSGTNRNFYICDNVLEGRHTWPEVSSITWDDEGITISGEGHTVCFNTLSGFGDALGLANTSDIPNIAVDFYGNDVLWTGDDGLELDFAHRNVRAFGNRITNAGMGVSMQPVWGGPVYVIRNVLLNIAASAYKLNNDPNGFFIYHNTSARTLGPGNWGDYAWTSLGYTQFNGEPAYAANFHMKNNILIGKSQPAYITTALILADIDGNGWLPDGRFRFVDSWSDFNDLRDNSPYEANGRILDSATFSNGMTLPADYTTFWTETDVTLGTSSLAIDAAIPLPNINDSFRGNGPDMGAIEYGESMPHFGIRSASSVKKPGPPINLRAE